MLRCSRFIYNLVVDSVHRTLFVNPIDTCVRVSVAMLCAIQYRCFSSFEWNWHNTTDEQSPFHSNAGWHLRTWAHTVKMWNRILHTRKLFDTHTSIQHTLAILRTISIAQRAAKCIRAFFHGVEPTTAMTTYDEDIVRWRQIPNTYVCSLQCNSFLFGDSLCANGISGVLYGAKSQTKRSALWIHFI